MISNWSNYFTLIVLITAVLALTAVLIMFIKEKLYKHKEIFLLINILIADLFFSVAYLSMLALLQNPQALLIPGIILDMAINASVFFAVIVSYCAYRCLYDPNYLNQKNNFIFLVIVGYITPIFYTIMLFVLPQFDQNQVLIVTVNLSYPLICVGVSFFFYVKIYLLFNVFELNKDQKSRIKILFLFPFIIFMLVLLPVVFQCLKENFSKNKFISDVGQFFEEAQPFLGIIDAMIYGKNVQIIYNEKKTKVSSGSLDSVLEISHLSHSELVSQTRQTQPNN